MNITNCFWGNTHRWRCFGSVICFAVVAMVFCSHRLEGGTITFDPEADTWVNSCVSGCEAINGNSLELRVRTAALWEDIKNMRSLLKFDLSSLPFGDARITDATLGIYYFKYHWDNPMGREYVVHRITTSWDEMDSNWYARDDWSTGNPLYWDSYLAGEPPYRPGGGDFDPYEYVFAVVPDIGEDPWFEETWMAWDVTDLVREWVNEDSPNKGLLVKDGNEFETYLGADIAWGPAQFRSSSYWDEGVWPYLEIVFIGGDYDDDGDIDLDDFASFPPCLSGPGEAPDFTPPSEKCLEVFDLDDDADVDLTDFAGFQFIMGMTGG